MRLLSFFFNKKKLPDKPRREDYYLGKELLEKAYTYLERNEYSKALPLLNRAIELGQKEGYYDRGLCFQGLGFNLEAIDDFTKAISNTPTDCNLYFCRGNSKVNLKEYDSAIEDGEKAIQLAKAGLLENKRYDEAAIAQGSNSAVSLYGTIVLNWKIMNRRII